MEYGNRLQVRTVKPETDQADVMRLYESGLLEDGARNHDDAAPDLENLIDVYLPEDGGSHFWVAVLLEKNGSDERRAAEPRTNGVSRSNADAGANRRAAAPGMPVVPPTSSSSRLLHAGEPGDSGRVVPDLPEVVIREPLTDGLIIGMIGAQRTDMHTIEIRRLRVDPAHRQRGVGKRLIETALDFCYEQGYLKVLLDTRIERIPAIALFERFGFQLNRTRDVNGKKVHDFYLNLYRQHEASRRSNRRRDDLGQGSTIVP